MKTLGFADVFCVFVQIKGVNVGDEGGGFLLIAEVPHPDLPGPDCPSLNSIPVATGPDG